MGESNCDMMCFFVEGVMILVGVDVDANLFKDNDRFQ